MAYVDFEKLVGEDIDGMYFPYPTIIDILREMITETHELYGDVIIRLLQIGFNAAHVLLNARDLRRIINREMKSPVTLNPGPKTDSPDWITQHAWYQIYRFMNVDVENGLEKKFRLNFENFINRPVENLYPTRKMFDAYNIALIGLNYHYQMLNYYKICHTPIIVHFSCTNENDYMKVVWQLLETQLIGAV